MFFHHKLNKCDCWDNGDFRITKQNGSDIYHAYKATSWDDDGNINGYTAIEKEVDRVEQLSVLDETGREKKDEQGRVITQDALVMKAKAYSSLDEAIAACV